MVRWGGRAGTGIGRGAEEALTEVFEDSESSVVGDILSCSGWVSRLGGGGWGEDFDAGTVNARIRYFR